VDSAGAAISVDEWTYAGAANSANECIVCAGATFSVNEWTLGEPQSALMNGHMQVP